MELNYDQEGNALLQKVKLVSLLNFTEVAIDVFRYQYKYNDIYAAFCNALNIQPQHVLSIADIPFLPIDFFKTHAVTTGDFKEELKFLSSGTTSESSSVHSVKDLSIYEHSFFSQFETVFGSAENSCIVGLLPSYLEKGDSSLVYMVNALIKKSKYKASGFFMHDQKALATLLKGNEENKIPTILFGVTYALLDFADAHPMALQHTTIVETGGMKGRKKELTKQEVHAQLQQAFSLQHIASEYGMTELLSQAYAITDLKYTCSAAMKIVLRKEDDPLAVIIPQDCCSTGTAGLVNVIDLYNIYSCAFIATDDVGKLYADGSFEILGRRDNSDIRGCSLLTT